jgi:transcriptional regulator of aromatic amino acid metabolism
MRSKFGGLVRTSPAMNAVVDRARRLAPSRLPLVLTGAGGVRTAKTINTTPLC